MIQTTSNPVGKSVPRVDAFEKVTGAAKYVDDMAFGPGLLYGKIVHSPVAHALIKKIDVSKALALPGVKAVVTGQDNPTRLGLYLKDRYIFAYDRVRYVGESVAGVVAISEEIAEAAAKLVEVEYEPLEPVFDPYKGAQPGAPLIHPDLGKYEVVNFIFPEPGTNISEHFKLRKGDVSDAGVNEAVWAQCAAIVEDTYTLPQIQHAPIETHVAVARWDLDGQITLWAASQSPFAQRDLLSNSLGVPHGNIRVISPYIGGGFGGKAGISIEANVVLMAKAVKGHPVKVRMTREEEFIATNVRQCLVGKYKVGCDAEGNLLAMEVAYYFGGGAYNDYGVNIVRAAGYSCTGPYDVPHVKGDSYCVYTNHPIGSAMRGFGMPEIHWGLEQVMDSLAEKIGMDPADFKRRNCVRTGDTILTGMTMPQIDLVTCIDKVTQAIGWKDPTGFGKPVRSGTKVRGKGLAIMWKAPAMPPNPGSSAIVRFNEDATVNVYVGGQEIGQGAFTVAAQIAAEALGVPYEWVRVSANPVDTKYSPYEWQTVASRLTWSMGNAVKAAAEEARRKILDIVAQYWGEDPADLDIKNGVVISYKSEREQSLQKMVVYGLPNENFEGWQGGPIVGSGKFMPTYVTGLDPETGQGTRAVVHYTVGAQAVEVEVDTETGQVDVLKIASAYDVGKAINPDLVMTQIEGGAVHGMSSAFEGLRFDDQGRPLNGSFVDYKIATALDAPRAIHGDIVETPLEDGPWGARGVGEHVMVPTAPAIANALYAATGVRFKDLPLSAEKIFRAMHPEGPELSCKLPD
ncbi:MAG TPA: xanthine dehydrogenase family protein molybdopterin-binding subunit [Anaerolineae bacterium]|nr:xanthine dehydrogenase family protein molybdopterin-binding subunit [Anaerolineae bacterium]HQK15787.1 xanthine dehydrogenase family protein molybdopterin-binding subunit [Anaerolineae bacterium]